jgi:hypothetical protein
MSDLSPRARLLAQVSGTPTKLDPKANAIKVYDGPSLLDGERIVVIVTGLASASANSKTGDMLQTWIMRYDIAPNEAIKTGADSSVCGNCPLRPLLKAARMARGLKKPCYVRVYQAPRSTWAANRDKPVTPIDQARALVRGRKVRRGSYGDPAAVPAWVWEALDGDAGETGYSHQWETADPTTLAPIVMASVHDVEEMERAHALGYRTFRVMRDEDEVTDREVLCPASKEAGARTTCSRCNLCNGSRGPSDKRRSVAIYLH